MADVQPVANAAWGGRRADGTYPLPTADETPADDVVVRVSRRDLASMVLLGTGTLSGVIGAAAAFGWPGALMAFAAAAVPTGLLLGVGE